jgi:hypothetical protein
MHFPWAIPALLNTVLALNDAEIDTINDRRRPLILSSVLGQQAAKSLCQGAGDVSNIPAWCVLVPCTGTLSPLMHIHLQGILTPGQWQVARFTSRLYSWLHGSAGQLASDVPLAAHRLVPRCSLLYPDKPDVV